MLISLRADKTRRICFDALLAATAMLLSYLETVIPLQLLIPLPGIRLGLANLAVVTVFALVSPLDAALVSAVRIFATGLLFGSVTSLYFSALGGLCAFFMLLLLSYVGKSMSFVGVSILSAAAHNAGQILAAVTLFDPSLLFSYLPMLLLAAILCGGAIGALLNLTLPRLQRILEGGRV